MVCEDEITDNIDILPDEVIVEIFKYLPLETLLTCENVCRRWRKLSRDTFLWKKFVIVYSGKCGQSEVSEKNLQIIKSHSQFIHCIKIQYVYSYSLIETIIKKCVNLISLELIMCRVSKEFEEDVMRWPNLKKLVIKNSLLLTNDADLNIHYDHFKYLNYLSLSDFGLNATNCNSLLNCRYLTHILIKKVKDLSKEFITKLIQSKKDIVVTLHIYGGNSIDDETLQILSHCTLLKDLAIMRCENLTDAGLIHLSNLREIEHLHIWNNSNFTEPFLLRTLSSPNLMKLQRLSFSRIVNISPPIVDIISEYYHNLKFLALYQCQRIINTDYEKQLKSKFRNIDVVLY